MECSHLNITNVCILQYPRELKWPKSPMAFLLQNSFWQIYTVILYSYICSSKLPMWTGILRTECFFLLQINSQQLLYNSLNSLKSKKLICPSHSVLFHLCPSQEGTKWRGGQHPWIPLLHHYKGLVGRTKSQFLATKELISQMGKRSTWMLA